LLDELKDGTKIIARGEESDLLHQFFGTSMS
jgi:hypothetical protein